MNRNDVHPHQQPPPFCPTIYTLCQSFHFFILFQLLSSSSCSLSRALFFFFATMAFTCLSYAIALLAPALLVQSAKILVDVGPDNQLIFSPSNVTALAGDEITFQFQSKNHSVTQSSFADPCTPLPGGVDSGFQPVAPNATAVPEFSLTLNNASTPLFFFSAQDAIESECQQGMVFTVNANPDSDKSFAAFQANAEASGSSGSESTAPPAASSSSGAEILVTVGGNNQLAFVPPNITAQAGDTITFQFESKNHSVTQSSFASPCTPLAGGVDSGFQPVAPNASAFTQFSLTLNNASTPLFFFSAQDAVESECQQGMVFTINADPNSDKSFAAFQANAEASGSAQSSSNAGTATSGAQDILIQVGPGNQLVFNPSNITAQVGDNVAFQFLSGNHSITQSSFADPCTPLASGAVDSGFQPVAANATQIPQFSFSVTNASTPLFFFSKQTAPVNECQQGMVFAINANPISDKSFAAFQANAEASAPAPAAVAKGKKVKAQKKKTARAHARDFSG
ncbi:hypothetical protein FB45DRAFT_992818 [Roridomyces roridus]|uniref:Uncharacterized protein n=1 Tax=Roridomyces roridus TaxID=1738132 RepID=A0AAD7BCE4_9AGAR|nr:hypothetical protein FB45DRAFT_992818 [Roridomyces roridus]